MNKIKFRFILITFIFLICFSSSVSAEDGALLDDPTLTDSIIFNNTQEQINKDNSIFNIITPSEPSSSYTISVSNYKQENGHYCGPASARQSLSFHKTKSGSSTSLPSQTSLAKDVGTTLKGSVSTGIRDALNIYAATYKFTPHKYVVANVGSSKSLFSNRILSVIKNKTNAPIILVETQHIPRYNGHPSRHYVTVSGHSVNQDGVRTVDPNNNTSYLGIYWDPMGSTANSGVFKAVYNADLHGTNYVMIY